MKTYQKFTVALIVLFVFGCAQMQLTPGPSDVMKTLSEASKTKDVAAIKNAVSKGTLGLMEESAKAQNTTIDELLKKDNGAPFKELPEMRNEKIEGDTATIELRNSTSEEWEAVPFVKEDGFWRLALDKYLEEFKKKATESMKMPPPPAADSNSNVPPNSNQKPADAANKTAKNKK